MITMDIYFWLLVAVSLLLALSLIITVIKLAKTKRLYHQLLQESSQTTMETERFGIQIQRQLFDQQIDAVFKSLTTIIETEGLKLKTLSKGWNLVHTSDQQVIPNFNETISETIIRKDLTKDSYKDVNEIGKKITEYIEAHMSQEEIAERLNLSLTEVALAMRLRHGKLSGMHSGRRLEAVA